VRTRDEDLGGVPARRFVPPDAGDGVVLYFHGGSYVYGSAKSTHADLLARIALAARVTVVGVDYRLAPEHPYPAQLEDALAAFEALRSAGTPAHKIVLSGDSAGGHLAIMTQIALRNRKAKLAAALALISPWSDPTMPGASFVSNDPYDFGSREVLRRQARMVFGAQSLDDPMVSPVRADLNHLGPVHLQWGELEICRDDIEVLAARFGSASGVALESHVAPDMPHDPPVFADFHPSGKAALDALCAFVTTQLAREDECAHAESARASQLDVS
jgi:acetyl esterase/lipase